MVCCSSCDCLHLGATGIRVLAVVGALFEALIFYRYFIAGEPFAQVVGVYGKNPDQQTIAAALVCAGVLGAFRFVFATRVTDEAMAQLAAVIHIAEVPVLGYVMHVNSNGCFPPKSLESLMKCACVQQNVVVFVLAVISAVMYWNWYSDLTSGAVAAAEGSVSVARSESSIAPATKSKSKSKSTTRAASKGKKKSKAN